MMRISHLLIPCCLATIPVVAQNTTTLPTSMYGVGELVTSDGGRYAGMGHIGIALNRQGFQNTQNPAAITGMDTLCFTFDVGVTATYARYSFLSDRSSSLTGNPNRISLGARLLPRWFVLAGAAPYSSTGYLIQTQEPVEGTQNQYVYSTFEGTGGLYRAYLTNAIRLTRGLSIGANVGMILGTVTQSETQEGATVQYESSKRAFYFDAGLHYESPRHPATGKQWSAGIVFAPSLRISHDNEMLYANTSGSESLDKSYHSRRQYLPMHLGAGFAMTSEHWVWTADYNYYDWSRSHSSYTSMEYENQHKLNAGFIRITRPRLPRCVEWTGGIGVGNSYITLKGGHMYYLEASLGGSFPIRYTYLSIGATWRKQLNSRSNLMQESRWSLHLNLTFGERLMRSKLQ